MTIHRLPDPIDAVLERAPVRKEQKLRRDWSGYALTWCFGFFAGVAVTAYAAAHAIP